MIAAHFHPVIVVFVLLIKSYAQADEMKNLTSISWSHATNNQSLLSAVLTSPIQMIEADIVFGRLIDDDPWSELQPIMSHPPNNVSDLSLKNFLNQVLDFNEKSPKEMRKGVKLDFKSTDVFEKSLSLLTELWKTMDYPVWINADVYRGPLNNTVTTPVDAQVFFDGIKNLPNATLSPGWTTRWGADFTEGNYTKEQVDEMIDGFKRNNIKNRVTFPVRAGIAAQSLTQLDRLYESLKESNSVTFTIWSSDADFVDVEKLRKMIFHFGLNKVYVDVPQDLSDKLRLNDEPTDTGFSLKPNTVLGSVMMMISMFMLFF